MIGITCALRCEAETLIDYFQLKAFPQKTIFPLFYNQTFFLIISGMGKISAAAATTYLHILTGERPYSGWVNIGIGGHRSLNIGEGVFAHQIVDEGSGKKFYPTFTWKLKVPTQTVFTVDSVENSFHQEGVYEMEASGFCTAFRFSSSELIHCYKVISDNLKKPLPKDPQIIRDLIKGHLSNIESLLNQLLSIQKELSDASLVSGALTPFLQKWHFTRTQLYQLQRYLQRWEAIHPNLSLFDERVDSCKKAKEVLAYLDQKVSQCFL